FSATEVLFFVKRGCGTSRAGRIPRPQDSSAAADESWGLAPNDKVFDMRRWRGIGMGAVGATVVLLGLAAPAPSQQLHRNGFETAKTLWVKAGSDTTFTEVAHASSDQGAHDGQRSEYIQISAKEGSFVHYQYAVGKAPVDEELAGGLWVKSNRAGIQLAARVILPNE